MGSSKKKETVKLKAVKPQGLRKEARVKKGDYFTSTDNRRNGVTVRVTGFTNKAAKPGQPFSQFVLFKNLGNNRQGVARLDVFRRTYVRCERV